MEHVKKTKKKTIIIFAWMLVFLWMGFIFYMSAQDSTSSSSFSRPIAESAVKYLARFNFISQNKTTDFSYIIDVESTVRMIAHSTVFFVLSVLVSLSLLLSDIKGIRVLFISIALSLFYAFADEFHQFFVPGRATEMADIFLDMLGILLGTALTVAFAKIFGGKYKKRVQGEAQKSSYAPIKQKVIEVNQKEASASVIQTNREKPASVKVYAGPSRQKLALQDLSVPLWVKLGFTISFSVLCAIISSNVKYMPIIIIIAFFVMLFIIIKTKFLDRNINRLSVPKMIFATILALFTIVRVYASFRLVANAYIAELGIVIDDLYYNFIRSGLSAFAVPSIIVLWYILIGKVGKLIKEIKFTKIEITYILVLSGLSFVSLVYIYYRTNAFYSPADNNNIIYSLDSYTIINEFSFTNFTSSINNVFQPVFSLGAMPFGVISSIIAFPLSLVPNFSMISASALSLSVVNAVALAISILLLSRALKINNKVFFILLMSISFPAIFSLLLVSGNIVVLFYMALFIFVLTKTDYDYAPMLTVLSSVFLPFAAIPLALDKHKNKFKKAIKSYAYLVASIILFSNFLSFSGVISTIKHIPRIDEIIKSILGFCSMSIFAPSGSVSSVPYYVYEYVPSGYIYVIGALIGLAGLAGFFWHRKDQSAKLGIITIIIGSIFSLYFISTLVPSGIILFLICFSWAFIALIYMLAEKILKPNSLVFKILMSAVVLVIALYNLKAIRDIIVFSFNYH